MSNWFPTEWHLMMTLIAVVGILITIVGISIRFGIWIGNVNDDRRDFKKFMNKISKDMEEFRKELYRIIARLPSPSSVTQKSPIKLSEFGENISESLSVRKWATDHAERLKSDASGKPEFEIFDMCVEHVGYEFENDSNFYRTIRKGAYEIGTDVEQVKKVYEVELRDALLNLMDS